MNTPHCAEGVVLYTDGSARPNPGFFGSGVHGYTYRYPVDGEKTTTCNSLLLTDKGYIYKHEHSPEKGAPVIVLGYLDAVIPHGDNGTNNIAEIAAITAFFDEFPDIAASVQKLHVKADSQYTINGLTKWISNWIRNHWLTSTGAPVSNREHWETLQRHLDTFREHAVFSIDYVQAHNDNFGNVKADYLSVVGTNLSTFGQFDPITERSEPLRYHKSDATLHPLLSFKRIYFNTDQACHDAGTYYQTSWSGSDYTTGKRTTDAAFSVVKLVSPDAVIESVIERQCAIPSLDNAVVYIPVDRIKNSDVYPYLLKYGRYALNEGERNASTKNACVIFLDKKPVTIEVAPDELPLRTIDTLVLLEDLLDRFQAAERINGIPAPYLGTELYQVIDITDHFYEYKEKRVGKQILSVAELKKVFVVGSSKTDVAVTLTVAGETLDLKLPLIFSDDFPGRNTMKHLEGLQPKVYFIAWNESGRTLRYATVIETCDSCSIWSNYFANQLCF